MYSARLLDHFEHPRHAGDLPEANARVRIENPACGDILELSAEVKDGVVHAIRFRAKGCVPSMACASALAELANGSTLASLSNLKREDVLREVDGVPPASGHAAQLAVDALRALLAQRAASVC
jgi:nitrogen fixation NifU-like protein